MVALDLGCGIRKKTGYIGVDRVLTAATDVVADVEKGLPFKDDSFQFVWINHVLEHVGDLVRVMEEIWRVAAPGAIVEVRGPHFSSPSVVWGDPTHRRALSYSVFFCFTPEAQWYYTHARFDIMRCQLKRNMGNGWPEAHHPWNYLQFMFDWILERLTNRSLLWIQRAERYWCRIVGFDEIQVILRVEKNMKSERPDREQ